MKNQCNIYQKTALKSILQLDPTWTSFWSLLGGYVGRLWHHFGGYVSLWMPSFAYLVMVAMQCQKNIEKVGDMGFKPAPPWNAKGFSSLVREYQQRYVFPHVGLAALEEVYSMIFLG